MKGWEREVGQREEEKGRGERREGRNDERSVAIVAEGTGELSTCTFHEEGS